MRSTFNANFLLRKNRISKDGLTTIDLVITVNTERVRINLGKKIDPLKWDDIRKRIKGNSEDSKAINEYLLSVKTKLIQCETDLLNNGFIITAELLRDAYLNNVERLKKRTLIDVFKEHNEQQEQLVKKNQLSKDTLFISEYTLRLVTDFLKKKFKRDDIYLRELNINFIK